MGTNPGFRAKSIVTLILIAMSIAGWAGCAEFSRPIPDDEKNYQRKPNVPEDIQDLAGNWEYKDKTGFYTIKLNEEGKGHYNWENGWFETHYLENGLWKGKWHQAGNDREGKFELEWSGDPPVAKGHWWYTRIGTDHNPIEPGGTFTMKRIDSFLTGGK